MTAKPHDDEDDKDDKPKGRGIFGALKGMIFEEEADSGDGDKPEPVPKPKPGTTTRPTTPVVAHAPAPHVTGGAAPDPKIHAFLEVDVREAAAPALTAFEKMCDTMATALPDEGTRYKAAMAAITPQGHTYAAVLKDVDECLEVLDKRRREKRAEMDDLIKKQTADRAASIADIEKSMAEKHAQIAALQNEIAVLESRKADETTAIESVRAEVDKTAAALDATVDDYVQQLEEQKRKITTHAKGV